jgi:hypothetical protein
LGCIFDAKFRAAVHPRSYLEMAMEKWLVSPDQDIRWIMKENLRKARLGRMDSHWVAEWMLKLGG